MEKNEKKKDSRARHWSFLVYPESAPEDWRSILENEMIDFAVSPIHDKDINEGTGEVKKAHFHVLLSFEGMKSFQQIKTITDKLQAPIPQIVNSAKGLIRYFVHRDNPKKAQYSVNDIYVHGDIDIISPFQTSSSRYEAIREMKNFIKENNIIEFAELFDYSADNNEEWFRYLCDSCAYIIQQYIKSMRHRADRALR